jgi:hypothetical protein
MGGWVGASDKASTGRAEKARVGGVGDTRSSTENHRLKTSELYRQAKGRNPSARDPSVGRDVRTSRNSSTARGNRAWRAYY